MSVAVDVTEELGSEIHVIFSIDAAPVRHESISSIVDESADDAAMVLSEGKSLWTARVAARSTVRQGQPFELAVDTPVLRPGQRAVHRPPGGPRGRRGGRGHRRDLSPSGISHPPGQGLG